MLVSFVACRLTFYSLWGTFRAVFVIMRISLHGGCVPGDKGEGGMGYYGFQVTELIEWGQISKPKKFTRASNLNYPAGIRGHYPQGTTTNPQIALNIKTRPLLKSNHTKKILGKFFYPKKSRK